MSTSSASPTLPSAKTVHVLRRMSGHVDSVAAAAGLAVAFGASLWMVLAAAERPSVLAPPTLRAPARWILGPLSGAIPQLTTSPTRLHTDLTIALVVMFGGWLVAWVGAGALPVGAVAAVVGLTHLVFLLGPPQPLTDFFNYMVYGRMAAQGVNPYTHVPAVAPHGPVYALSNWHHLPSPYGPLFTFASEPLGLMPPHLAYWVWKLVVVGCSLGAVALIGWLAVRLGRSPQRAIACAGLCPVTLAIGVGGFHNDTPAVLCLVAAIACLVKGARADARWDAAAGALTVVAAGIKPSFAIVVPLVVLGAHRRTAALAGAAWAGAAVVALVVLAFGGAVPAIGMQGRLVTPLSIPNLFGLAAGHGGADAPVRAAGRDALLVVVAVATALVAWRRRWVLPALGLVMFCGALSLSWVMPWYLAWSLPLVALARPRALAPVAAVTCVWLLAGGTPVLYPMLNAVGYHPTHYVTGLANHNYLTGLVR